MKSDKVRIATLLDRKHAGEKIVMITAYDAPSARAVEAARSEPAWGSLIPIAEKYRPALILGSSRRRCSSEP